MIVVEGRDQVTATCTIGPYATTGERCGEPAVVTFKGRDGRTYAECERHAYTARPGLEVGERVFVTHANREKIGTVTKVGYTRASVEVPLADGTTKVIHRPRAALRRIT